MALLSPELVSELDKGTKEPKVDWFKFDIFFGNGISSTMQRKTIITLL